MQDSKENQKEEMIKCPDCSGEAVRVIAAGFPMRLCQDEDCGTLWGFWSPVYVHFFAPLEAEINESFYFMAYEGPYLFALWYWLFGFGKDSE